MPKIHTHLCQIVSPAFDAIEKELFVLPEYPSPAPDGWLVGLDEVAALLKISRQSELIVRFHDCGFPITTAWHWLGDGVGLAHLIVAGTVGQVHLMVAGTNTDDNLIAGKWLSSAGVDPDTALPTPISPSLITLERDGYDDHVGGYLLGMILFAPFCEACGVRDSAA